MTSIEALVRLNLHAQVLMTPVDEHRNVVARPFCCLMRNGPMCCFVALAVRFGLVVATHCNARTSASKFCGAAPNRQPLSYFRGQKCGFIQVDLLENSEDGIASHVNSNGMLPNLSGIGTRLDPRKGLVVLNKTAKRCHQATARHVKQSGSDTLTSLLFNSLRGILIHCDPHGSYRSCRTSNRACARPEQGSIHSTRCRPFHGDHRGTNRRDAARDGAHEGSRKESVHTLAPLFCASMVRSFLKDRKEVGANG